MVQIQEADVNSPEARQLLGELNSVLEALTGASGAKSFAAQDVQGPRAAFLIARVDGAPMGCGAFREVSDSAAELKRVYARPNQVGVGNAVLVALEERATGLGYRELILEARRVNRRAVGFYLRHGYVPCENYGRYAGHSEAICFCKRL